MKAYLFCILLAIPAMSIGQSLAIPLITTTGTSEVYVSVDEVHFQLTITQMDAEISEARAKNIAVSKQVTDILKSKGVPSKYIQSASMSVNRNYIRNTNLTKWDGYISTKEIYICLLDPSKYDDIADELLETDLATLRGPDYKSSRTAEAMEQARTEAILISQKKAKQLAEALGQSIGGAKLIKENHASSHNTGTYSSGTSLVADAEGSNQSYEPGQLRIKASVTASYELKE